MQNSSRVIINSTILYAKMIIGLIISMWTVPIVLRTLGQSDYGLYNLIAGIISSLAFINTALAISSQRYLSVTLGTQDKDCLNTVYNISILLHLIIGICVVLALELLAPVIFHEGLLNIPEGREPVAKILYQILIASTFISIVQVPFDAVLNAYENMLVYSIILIIQLLLKLLVVYSLTWVTFDKLLTFGCGMLAITFIALTMTYLYTRMKYKDVYPDVKHCRELGLMKDMFGFAGWNTFGALAAVGRTQGNAVILNIFYNTIVNAAFGIAMQIDAIMNLFSQTIKKGLNPQIMKSEGMDDRDRMMKLCYTLSKFCIFVLGLLSVALVTEMPYILTIWLKNVPQYTIPLARGMIIVTAIYQLSSGLISGLQATGKIADYQFTTSLIILLNVPFSWGALWLGASPVAVVTIMVFVEVCCMINRLRCAKKVIKLDVFDYLKNVIFPGIVMLFLGFSASAMVVLLLPSSFFRLVFTTAVDIIVIGLFGWFVLLNSQERNICIGFLKAIKQKLSTK